MINFVKPRIYSSAYPVPIRNNPYFIVDARLHPGISGSSVITKPSTIWRKKFGGSEFTPFSFYLLGINAMTFPLPKKQKSSDLNAVYFASIIEGMTSKQN
jgi:hypothetical protein